MPYQSAITIKGQVTIPKFIRDALHIAPHDAVIIELDATKKAARIRPARSFLRTAKRIHLRTGTNISPLKARKAMEKRYARS